MQPSDSAEPEKACPHRQQAATPPPTLLLRDSFPSAETAPHKPTQLLTSQSII
nr:MAG TPA: hypothetical protein [Caudoviricetes sp.]DAK84233.1 MAG TPA: hypothetical protein [Caudoviricetes sp.]